MKLLLTLDVGTTAVKAGLFSEDIEALSFVTKEYTLNTPSKGIVELDPAVYWTSAIECIQKIIRNSDINIEDIVCITCTTQGETLIPVDAQCNALHNAIVWLDSRAEKQSEQIEAKYTAQEFYSHTGCPEISPIWPISKILWLKSNKPDVYKKTHKILLLEDYLVAKLTGVFVTNPAVSCSTGYFDINTGKVWSEILEVFDIDVQKIPDVLPCSTKVGTLSEVAAKQLGLSTNTIITTGAMDQVAAAIGSGNVKEGIVSETTGTAQVVAATSDMYSINKWSPVTVYAHAIPGKHLLVNISQTAGIILKWFRDEFCKDITEKYGADAFNVMGEMAQSAPILANGLTLFPHFTGMQIPELNSKTKGVFFGVGLHTGRDCFIRAIMESVGYILKENIEALEEMGISPSLIYSIGGGAKSAVWNQIKADICNQTIAVMNNEEATSLGAAILGGVACDLYSNIEDALAHIQEKQRFLPKEKNTKVYQEGYVHYKKMYKSFKELF